MPDDLERLRKQIEEGLEAVRELKRLTAEKERRERPKLRLIKGGLLGGAIWAGVEWLRDYKRIAVALAATAITITGAVIAERPHSPGSDPPSESISQPPPIAEPSKHATTRPTPAPRRTSPPRTVRPLARISPQTEIAPTARPTPSLLPVPPSPGAAKPPAAQSPAPKPTASRSVIPTVTPPVTVTPTVPCVIDLLGIRVCLRLG